jgi:transmembrane sensor
MTSNDPQRGAPIDPVTSTALDWFALRQGAADAAGDPAFEAWLRADPAHAAAYARVEGLWREPAFAAAVSRQTPARRRVVPRPALALMLRLAASIAVVALIGAGTLRLAGIPLRLPADYATNIGTEQAARLDDGTRLVLDTASAADISYTARQRQVRLRAGRIFVTVAPDSRPFAVVAGDVVVRDIGTAFSVERDGDAVRVVVRQGEVGVTGAAAGAVELHLHAGEAGGYTDEQIMPATAIAPDIAFAWLDHRLFFQRRPLGEVVDELRRYQRGWIVIANPALKDIKVSGGYDLDDPAAAIRDLARLSGASLVRVSDRLLILR